MDDLLEFLLGFVVDGAMDAVDSPRVPLWWGRCWRFFWGAPSW